MININTIKEFISMNYPNTSEFKEITLVNSSNVQTFEFIGPNNIPYCFVVFPKDVHPKNKTILKAYYLWYFKKWFNLTVKQKSRYNPGNLFIVNNDFEYKYLLELLCEYCLINAKKLNFDIMVNLIDQLDIIDDQKDVEYFAGKFESANSVEMAGFYMAEFIRYNIDVLDIKKIFKNFNDDNLIYFFNYCWKICDFLMSFNATSDVSGAYNILTDYNYYDANFEPLYNDDSTQYNGYIINTFFI